MNIRALTGASALAVLVSACGSGDIKIDAQNNSQTVNPPSTSSSSGGNDGGKVVENPCAAYNTNGVTTQGAYDEASGNCSYPTTFVDLTNPLVSTSGQITFRDVPGAHIFEGSLVVGRNYNSDADYVAAGISKGGDGAIIRIEAGAVLGFQSSEDYMVINRGSQIFAEGESDRPIVITSLTDIEGTVGAEDVQQWGGMIINGFGITNKCSYTGSFATEDLATSDCHVAAEGKAGAAQTHYGGANNDDSSGVLRYFVVKHTGAQVEEDNELNGISFNAVGAGTEVDYLQAYSTFDDGIEFFGGAVNVGHYVALYVRDDSIDIDEGYRGTIDHALVIQSETDGNRCVESDGIGSYSSREQAVIDDFIARGLNSQATIKNLTCIVSPTEAVGDEAGIGTGTHDPGQGLRIREAHFPTIENAVITTAYAGDAKKGDDDYNYCVRIDNEGQQAADDGDLVITSSIVACQDLADGGPLPSGTTTLEFVNASNDTMQTLEDGDDPTAASNANLVILDGFYSVALADMVINGGPVTVTPTDGRAYVGAVVADSDWTAGWTYGLHDGARGQALWFE